jgi:hypothetical protein
MQQDIRVVENGDLPAAGGIGELLERATGEG